MTDDGRPRYPRSALNQPPETTQAPYFRLAVDFIDSYRLRAKADGSIRPNASIKREKALRRTLEEAPFGGDLEGLQFAIWSLSDIVRAEGR